MGKRNLGGNLIRHAGAYFRGGDGHRCIGCGVTIFYGERCPPCTSEMGKRRRRKRKPR